MTCLTILKNPRHYTTITKTQKHKKQLKVTKFKEAANVTAYDPIATPNAKTIFKNKIQYATSTIECLKNADCCILVTEWKEFKKLKPEDFVKNMKQPMLIDGRRIFDPKEFSKKLKFAAIGLGH